MRPETKLWDASRSRYAPALLFARHFVRHPRMLGSVVPSSRYLVERLLRYVDWRRARVVVEYGPGVGTFTREILNRLRPHATLVVIEKNPAFVRYLQESLDDPRLQIVAGSAENVTQILLQLRLLQADYLIAGIPFSTLPGEDRRRILSASREVLAPSGEMLVYQFSGSVRGDLQATFERVSTGLEPRNFPPARWFRCRKAEPTSSG